MTETMREVFNSRIKPKYTASHTPQCKKCMYFHPWGGGSMDVHHIVALVDGGSNENDNLITLCANCHMEWHNHFDNGQTKFSDWLQRVPLWVYSALGREEDDAIRHEYMNAIDSLWPAVQDRRMTTEPFKDERCRKYTKMNSKNWVDW